MTKKLPPRTPEGIQPARSLSRVLQDSEHVRGLVKESGDELASVNQVLGEEFADTSQLPEVEKVLEKSEAVETKVKDASEKLTLVNRALEKEVKELHLMERELAQIKTQRKEALHASLHDALTGLPNRVLFNDRLTHAIGQAKRHGWTLAVMFLDLNKFKAINDTYGHAVGDSVLRTIAKRLKETTRTEDTISRHGGDEFLYLLMEIEHEHDAATVAKKIIQAVEEPFDVNTGGLKISTSIGISIFPKDGHTVDALISNADAAMYRAKQDKSGYAFAST